MPARPRRRGQMLRDTSLPAPTGSMNTVDSARMVPPSDCIYAYNLIASELGLRSRLGYQEWCTGLTGATDNEVRTILPFVGDVAGKLFCATAAGIWDVTSSTAMPTQLVTFGVQSGEAGRGSSHVVATPAGRFLLYCDEENGLFVYSEGADTWAAVALGVTQLWKGSTAVLTGNQVVNGGNVYRATQDGVTASSGGPTGTGTGITDGTTKWDYVSASSANVIGPSLADQQLGYTGDPAGFAFVAVWGSRVWFVEKGSPRAWYLDVNSIYGTATSFPFGLKMRQGGPLMGLYDWSYDAGGGMDSKLVGISSGGDVVIYAGTDPTSANTFGLVGSWNVGGVPAGRDIATKHGGDILILSALGVLPLSKLVVGQPVVAGDRSLYATGKITNLYQTMFAGAATRSGWSILIHPNDNALMVLVPSSSGQPLQLAQSLTPSRGWSVYRDLPMLSAAAWNGELYFGTTDGRVCRNAGYVDAVTLADPNSFAAVNWSVLLAYSNFETSRQKRIHMIRPVLESQTPNANVQATAKFNYDLLEPPPPAGSSIGEGPVWDVAVWDQSIWGGDYTVTQGLSGATGCGRDVAIAVRGAAISRTVLVGIDVFYELGGLL